MRREELFQILGEIDEEFIEEALPGEKKREKSGKVISFGSRMRKTSAMAAAAAAAVITIGLSGSYLLKMPAQSRNTMQTAGDAALASQMTGNPAEASTVERMEYPAENTAAWADTDPVEVLSMDNLTLVSGMDGEMQVYPEYEEGSAGTYETQEAFAGEEIVEKDLYDEPVSAVEVIVDDESFTEKEEATEKEQIFRKGETEIPKGLETILADGETYRCLGTEDEKMKGAVKGEYLQEESGKTGLLYEDTEDENMLILEWEGQFYLYIRED